MSTAETKTGSWVQVWDSYVRFFHWSLAACFAVAYLTGEDADGGSGLHIWAGYAICALLVTRVIWGFIGSGHARFSDFAYSPATIIGYLKDMLAGRAKRYLGHSPAGAAMIFALLICLTGTVWTGLQVYAEEGKGPLASNGIVVTQALADEHRGGDERHEGRAGRGEARGESATKELHETFANLTLGLVVLHLCGVAFSSLAHRENLVAAMLSGRKRADEQA